MNKIKVSNDRPSSITPRPEPWGEDYGTSPGGEFEVAAADAEENFHSRTSYDEKGMKVYAEGGAKHLPVYQAGEALSCGRNRRAEEWQLPAGSSPAARGRPPRVWLTRCFPGSGCVLSVGRG
jgi:hypothetical protein